MAVVEGAETLDGVIEPFMTVELSSRVDGILEAVSVDVGDSIEKNQVVAKLESEVEQAALDYARAKAAIDSDVRLQEVSYAYGQRQLKRIEELHDKKLSSFQDFDKVKTESRLTQYKLAQAKENQHLAELDLKQAQELYNRHTLRSPIDRIVVDRYLNPGESVEERPIVKIAQINPLRVEVVAPISLLGKIKTGQLAMVQPEMPVGGSHEAVVKIVDPIVDAASGTFRIRLEIPNDDFSLISGLRCQVNFLDKMATSGPRGEGQVLNQKAKSIASTIPIPSVSQLTEKRGGDETDSLPRYQVVSDEPKLPLNEAMRKVASLRKKGVKDTYLIAEGTLKGAISLGDFHYRQMADIYRHQLAGLGIASRVVTR
jgi:RND family efflux transporter MFP subunit